MFKWFLHISLKFSFSTRLIYGFPLSTLYSIYSIHNGILANQDTSLYFLVQYWSLLNWRKIRFGCGSAAVPVNLNCVVISPPFAIFKNVVYSLKPGETPSYSASYQASNYVQRSEIFQNVKKTVRCGCGSVALIF